jgi:hypothetical protein
MHPGLAQASEIKIEESSEMSQERQKERRWTVQRRFEPDRLSQVTLERAYMILVPPYTLVLRFPTGVTEEPSEFCQQTAERCAR